MLPEADLRPVAFYVHHHGSGHATRTKLLAARWPTDAPLHVFTSAPERFRDWRGGSVHPLPLDVDDDRDPAQDLLDGQVLHYAPVDLPPLQQRMALMAQWIATHRPSLFVVDLSVEVALFTRLCGCRTALVRLHGRRDDPAHLAAFRLADQLIAPFPAALDDAHTPDWVRDKTHYLGTFSRYDDRHESRADCRQQLGIPPQAQLAVVINGQGGAGTQVKTPWNAIAKAHPTWTFLLVGKLDAPTDPPANLVYAGFVADTFPYLKAADVVVGSGGTNTMMEVGAARVPFLSQPEPRPFDEQLCKMQALERLGLTRIVPEDTGVEAWGSLLAGARRMDVSGWEELPKFGEELLGLGVVASER